MAYGSSKKADTTNTVMTKILVEGTRDENIGCNSK